MPVMLRGFIPEDEWLLLAELSYFFRVLCAKELSPGVLEEMEELAPEFDLQVREDLSTRLL